MKPVILVISNQVVSNNSKVNWPDMNYIGSGQTILRTLHKIDYEEFTVQLDTGTTPIIKLSDLPEGVAFYELVEKNTNSKKKK